MTEIRALIGLVISSIISLFTPIVDVMIAMLVLFSANGVFGLVEDILHADGWKTKKRWRSSGSVGCTSAR